jgi:hypothetical protein
MDVLKGAGILAARIARSKEEADHEWLRWSPQALPRDDPRCIRCGSAIAEVLAVLGSLRCHDCRTGREY